MGGVNSGGVASCESLGLSFWFVIDIYSIAVILWNQKYGKLHV